MTDNCIFCKIIAGEIPSQTVYQDELVTAFRDIAPIAPTHILIVPNQHIVSLGGMSEAQAGVLGRMVKVANDLAVSEGIDESGYRFITMWGRIQARRSFMCIFICWAGVPWAAWCAGLSCQKLIYLFNVGRKEVDGFRVGTQFI